MSSDSSRFRESGDRGRRGCSCTISSTLLFLLCIASCLCQSEAYRLALVTGSSDFFEPIRRGWNESCAELDVECEIYDKYSLGLLNITFNQTTDQKECVPIIRYLIQRGDVDALSVKCNLREDQPAIIQEAHDAGIPTVVFAGPHVGPYISYIGTDNDEIGRATARLLKQLRPEGGTYVVVYNEPSARERAMGFVAEIEKDNNRDDRAHWIEEPSLNYTDLHWMQEGAYMFKGTTRLGWDYVPLYLNKLFATNPTAFVFMYQTPTRHPNFTQILDENRWRNVSILGMDGNGNEMDYLARGYMDGIIGQTTYETGLLMPQTLYKILTEGKDSVQTQYLTPLLNHNLVPAVLPDLEIDQSLLGDLRYIGFTCFGIVALTAICFMVWTFANRKNIVVRASQPHFLFLVAFGILVTASTLIPLSFDDQGLSDISHAKAVGICMSIPWLAFCGFSITFSALFSKTWRVNKFFNSKASYARIKITYWDVIVPFVVIFSLNLIILLCWTLLDPLTYERRFALGTDLWNRDIASNGQCKSEQTVAYLVPLAIVNFCVLMIACWQALQARDIKSEFAEAKWIGWCMFSMTQGFLTGVPIVIVTRDIPEAFYLTLTFLLFVLCMVILILIFVPKIRVHRRYEQMSPAEQKRAMAVSIRQSHASFTREVSAPKFGSSAFRSAIKEEQATKAQKEPSMSPIQDISEGDVSSSKPSENDAAGTLLVEKIRDSESSKRSSYIEDVEEEDTDVHDT